MKLIFLLLSLFLTLTFGFYNPPKKEIQVAELREIGLLPGDIENFLNLQKGQTKNGIPKQAGAYEKWRHDFHDLIYMLDFKGDYSRKQYKEIVGSLVKHGF